MQPYGMIWYDYGINIFTTVGELQSNHEIMRDILSLTQRLPVMTTEMFKSDFFNVSIVQLKISQLKIVVQFIQC